MSVLPLDCIGVIVEFLYEGKTVNRILEASKITKKYIEITNPNCCENVQWILIKTPKVDKPYVLKLKLDKSKSNPDKNFIKFFPNVKSLHFYEVTGESYSNDLFLQTPKLEKLVVESSKPLLNPSFKNLKELRHLEYDNCHLRSYNTDVNNLHTSSFRYLENLETLVLSGVKTAPKKDQAEDFENMKKLRKLTLTRTKGFTNSIFSELTQIEVLKVIQIWDFTLENFDKLGKLEKLMVDGVMRIASEDAIVRKMGRKPKILRFRKAVMAKGDVATPLPLKWSD